MTLEEALTIHIIHNHYTFSTANVTLEAFKIEAKGGFSNELVYAFRDYIKSLPHINNSVMFRLNFISHHLTKLESKSQFVVIDWLLAHKT